MSKINVDSLAVPAFTVAVAADGVLRYDGINKILCQISGLTKDMFIGRTPADFASYEGAQAWEANYRRCLASGVMDEFEELVETPSGLRWWRTILSPVVDESGAVVQLLGLSADISARKRAETELQSAAYVDPVTGIGNRRCFDLDLASAIARSTDTGTPFALILADIDRLKSINDTFGHEVGDEVIRATARRLRTGVRDHDKIARIGGDEFAAILSVTTPCGVEAVMDRIEQEFAETIHCDDACVPTSLSLGAALWNAGMSAEELRRAADAAMYERKRNRPAQTLSR